MASLTSLPALAQAVADEWAEEQTIVVTAQRREEASVDVPITITSLDAQQLETANVSDLSDIAKVTPSLRFDFTGAFFQPTIRGIGTAVVSSGSGSNVGIYVDGFYSPNPIAADFQLVKTKSVQVLKGPQGTLFGRNTTGGAILVETLEPSTQDSMEFKLSFGRYNETRAQAYATVGLTEAVALDVEGVISRADGWLRNITTGGHVGDSESSSVRVGLKADLSESISVLLRYQHSEKDDPSPLLTNIYVDPELGVGAPNFATPGSFTTNPNEVALGAVHSYLRSNSDVLQATIRADLGFADLTSYSQYRADDTDVSLDTDRTALNLVQIGIPNINRTASQEFLLTAKPGSALQWTAGLFYFRNKDRYLTFLDGNPAARIRLGGSSTTTQTYAGFADLTYEVTPQLYLTVGARYSYDTVTDAYFNPAGSNGAKQFVPSLKSDKVTPRVVVRYKPTEDTSVYASYSKGYKSGILDVGGGTGNRVSPEDIDAFEVGVKHASRGFSLEASAFHYDYKNLQVSLFQNAIAKIINAASSEIYGVDVQTRIALSDSIDLNAGAAWVHARYKRFTDAPLYRRCPTAAGCGAGTSFFIQPVNLENATMQRSPAFTGNIGARYRSDLFDGKLTLSSNLYYSSKFYFGPSGIQYPQNGYEVLALRAKWVDPSDHFSISLWGDNVTNSRYLTQVQYNNFAIGGNWNKPVTYGLEVGVSF